MSAWDSSGWNASKWARLVSEPKPEREPVGGRLIVLVVILAFLVPLALAFIFAPGRAEARACLSPEMATAVMTVVCAERLPFRGSDGKTYLCAEVKRL